MVLTKVQTGIAGREAAGDFEETSDDDTDIAATSKEEVVRQLIMQLKSFDVEKSLGIGMLSGVAVIERAFSTYICNMNTPQTNIDFFFKERIIKSYRILYTK